MSSSGPRADARILDRKGERERASLPDLAFDPETAAVQLDEPLRQGEAEPGALLGVHADLALLELLEDARLILERDPGSRVADRDARLAVEALDAHVDRAALRCELHRVRKEVEEHLFHFALVSGERLERRVDLDRHRDAAPRRALAQHRRAALHDLA